MVRLVSAVVALLKSNHKIICFSKQKSCPCVPMLQKQRIPPTCHIVDQYSHRCTITKDKLSIMQMYPILSNFSCGIQDWKCHCQNSGCSLKTGSCDSMGVLLVFKLFLIAIENQKKIVLSDLSYFVKTKLPFTLFLLSPFAAAPMQMKFPCLYLVLTLHKKKKKLFPLKLMFASDLILVCLLNTLEEFQFYFGREKSCMKSLGYISLLQILKQKQENNNLQVKI